MANSDLQARPVYHRTRDLIEAHLTIVFAALAVSRWIEHQTASSGADQSRAARSAEITARADAVAAASR